jgi:hypothetical protein
VNIATWEGETDWWSARDALDDMADRGGYDLPDDRDDTECGASSFADCPLSAGHPGVCIERLHLAAVE